MSMFHLLSLYSLICPVLVAIILIVYFVKFEKKKEANILDSFYGNNIFKKLAPHASFIIMSFLFYFAISFMLLFAFVMHNVASTSYYDTKELFQNIQQNNSEIIINEKVDSDGIEQTEIKFPNGASYFIKENNAHVISDRHQSQINDFHYLLNANQK